MLTRPAGISDLDVTVAVAEGWGMSLGSVEWVPLGFGSHHWHGTDADTGDWFITLDDLDLSICDSSLGRDDTFQTLRGALGVALNAADAGLGFVVGPRPDWDGEPVRRLGDRWALAVYPWVEGTAGFFSERHRADAVAILDLLVDLHTRTGDLRAATPVDGGNVPRLDSLLVPGALAADRWTGGPYGEPARRLLQEATGILTAQARDHAGLWREISSPARLVVTHGEPHPGNTLQTSNGWLLVDWDTTRLAPPERDLWMLVDSAPECLDQYASRTGQPILDAGIEFYRRGWTLSDAACAATYLRQPHDDTDDARKEWALLQRTVEHLAAP